MSGWNEASVFLMLLGVALKSTAVLSVAWVFALLLRKRSAAARHLVWTAAAAAIVALPFLSMSLPVLQVPLTSSWISAPLKIVVNAAGSASPIPGEPRAAVLDSVAPAPRNSAWWWSPDWKLWLMLFWAAGAAILVVRVLVAYAFMWRIRRTAKPFADDELYGQLPQALGIHHPVGMLKTADRSMPMTFGLVRPAILMPANAAEWSVERRRIVLLHELAHVRRGDAATHLLARVALALCWWNPLAWTAWREFLKESERAADDLVLSAGARASEYASHLLDVARTMQCVPSGDWAAVAMARRSQLEGRLLAILDSGIDRKAPGRVAALITALLAIALIAPLSAVRAQETGARLNEAAETAPDVDAMVRSATSQKNYAMLENAAAAAERMRKFETAEQLLQAALTIRAQISDQQSPEYGVGLLKLAELEQNRHSTQAAQDFYTKAAQILGDRPEAATALLHLGTAALIKKDFSQAMDYFERAQHVDSSQAALAIMWTAVARQAQGDLDEAETLYKNAIAQGGKSPYANSIMRLYANFLRKQGRDDEAGTLDAQLSAMQNASRARSKSQPPPAGVYRVADGVIAPKLLAKTEPEYSDDAKTAKLDGTELIDVQIGTDGLAHNAQVVQGLGLGLDENAIQAIGQWRFQPGMKDGQPVTVTATIEIHWRLM